jgi:hypothetical protein
MTANGDKKVFTPGGNIHQQQVAANLIKEHLLVIHWLSLK